MKRLHQVFSVACVALLSCYQTNCAIADEAFDIADGFEISEVTTPGLVTDVFCMTTDTKGRPVVSGPGYIKTLLDKDEDGVFESAVTWTTAATQGAQGMWSDSTGLYYVSDNALWLSRDSNDDLRADGRPARLLSLPTGGEHDTHAIRKGPDGYWYFIAGNFARGIARLANDPDAPISKPRCGTLWRCSPDFQKRSVIAHGIRNSYDFDFLPSGEIVIYDSDGERDITMPWYRPTRVMAVSPGADCGWAGDASKDPSYRITMPRVLAELGRGSPTGVVVYDHYQFPKKYRHAAFVLDWTFGRILAVYPSPDDSNDRSITSETFVQTQGQIGFAPTDIVIEPSGSLLVCVGGRGTRGAVYRISSLASGNIDPVFASDVDDVRSGISITSEDSAKLSRLLAIPCPNESWSESAWAPMARQLGGTTLASAAVGIIKDPDSGQPLTADSQVAALHRLTRMQIPLSAQLIDQVLASPFPKVRAAGWTAIGTARISAKHTDEERWRKIPLDFTQSNSSSDWDSVVQFPVLLAQVQTYGLRRWPLPKISSDAVDEGVSTAVKNAIRQRFLWAATRAPQSDENTGLASLAGPIFNGVARINGPVLDAIARKSSNNELPTDEQGLLETLVVVQSALGDNRFSSPQQTQTPNPSIFDGYTAIHATDVPNTVRDGWSNWLRRIAEKAKSDQQRNVLVEATRTMAMFEPTDGDSLQYAVDLISEKSHPTNDLHALCIIGQCSAKRTPENTAAIARALLSLNAKVQERNLNTDNRWQPRLDQLYARLAERDPNLAAALLNDETFGRADQLWLANALPKNLTGEARKRISAKLTGMPIKEWSGSLIRFASYGPLTPTLKKSLRSAATEPSLRATVVELLSKNPQPDDYNIFLDAIASSDRQAWPFAWLGLTKLPITDAKRELYSLSALLAKSEGTTVNPKPELLMRRLQYVLTEIAPEKKVPPAKKFTDWIPALKQYLSPDDFDAIEKLRQPAGNWIALLEQSKSLDGQIARGQTLFKQAKCSQCHGSGIALGPSLSGITRRFSQKDLFRAIYEPSRDISDRYRSITVATEDGEVITGLKIYASVDGVTLQTAQGELARINQDDIVDQSESSVSIMPTGLIDGFSPQQIADLNAYLKSL